MQQIQLNAVPSQTLSVTLGTQSCQLNIYTLSTGLYMDVLLNGNSVARGVLCLNNNKIVRAAYTGFVGDLMITDTQGINDPTYDGLGARYQLVYLEAADL